jgi:hypothetical protein
MSPDLKEFTAELRNDIREVKEKGQKIEPEALLRWMEKMERELEAFGDRPLTQAEREHLQAHANLAHYSATVEFQKLSHQSVLDSAVAALKTTLIINGAAAIAVLGFIANTADVISTAVMSKPLLTFGLGAFAASAAYACMYFAQYAYTHKPEANTGERWRAGAIAAAIVGLACFIGGVIQAGVLFGAFR